MSSANISRKSLSKFRKYFLLLIIPIAFFLVMVCAANAQNATFIINPVENTNALRNPLMGFSDGAYEYKTLNFINIDWNELENNASDSVDKITKWTNNNLAGIENNNVKAVLRVRLECSTCDPPKSYWPADMTTGDYSSAQFKTRLVDLIEKMALAWDNDPRVAFVEIGLIGNWGEQSTPPLNAELETLIGNAFKANFKNKLSMVRYPWNFKAYNFGIYWDSFAHYDQENEVSAIKGLDRGNRWKTAVIGGETAYDWGNYKIQPGDNPDDTLTDPVHRDYVIDRIRDLHISWLGWIASYTLWNQTVTAGAELVQKAFGYRFVIEKVEYNQRVDPGGNLQVSFVVRNKGSAPFYYNWPVEVSLLDPDTKQELWNNTFSGLDIRKWQPGDNWNYTTKKYDTPPNEYNIQQAFSLPSSLPTGEYILALAILDPAGNLPSVKFAIKNYYNGGRHPIGKIGVGVNITNPVINNFDNPGKDNSLHYTVLSTREVIPMTLTVVVIVSLIGLLTWAFFKRRNK